jgi:hypothetical protein
MSADDRALEKLARRARSGEGGHRADVVVVLCASGKPAIMDATVAARLYDRKPTQRSVDTR